MENNNIYALKDPNGIIRYIGQTTLGVQKRLQSHKRGKAKAIKGYRFIYV